MDNDNSPMLQDDPDSRKVNVWTPEDAARFLSSAIQEAQRPLTDTLRRRSVSPGIFALVIVLLVAAAAACGWILFDRLEKSDRIVESARLARDQALDQRHEMQARHDVLASSYTAARESADRNRREREAEIEKLRTEATGLRGNEDELRRMRANNQHLRRQYELLLSQIDGLEMEKQALARQLAAVKALSMTKRDPALNYSDESDIVSPLDVPGLPGPQPPALAAPEAKRVPTAIGPPPSGASPASEEPAAAVATEGHESGDQEMDAASPLPSQDDPADSGQQIQGGEEAGALDPVAE